MMLPMRKCPKCGYTDPAAVRASRKYQRKKRLGNDGIETLKKLLDPEKTSLRDFLAGFDLRRDLRRGKKKGGGR